MSVSILNVVNKSYMSVKQTFPDFGDASPCSRARLLVY